jgi:Flp pilus assembly pilin Flp
MKNKGQALVEYVLIIILVSLALYGVVKIFGGYLKDKITEMGCDVSNQQYKEGKKAGDGTCIEIEEKDEEIE